MRNDNFNRRTLLKVFTHNSIATARARGQNKTELMGQPGNVAGLLTAFGDNRNESCSTFARNEGIHIMFGNFGCSFADGASYRKLPIFNIRKFCIGVVIYAGYKNAFGGF